MNEGKSDGFVGPEMSMNEGDFQTQKRFRDETGTGEGQIPLDGSGGESAPKKRRVEDIVLPPGRSIFIGAVHPQQVSLYDIVKMATTFGGLESVKMVPEKHCAFVNYATEVGAKALIEAHQRKSFYLGQRELKIRWARTERLPADVEECIKKGGSRRLLVEHVNVPEELLFHTFLQHGEIENWNFNPHYRTCIVCYLDIRNAMAALRTLNNAPLLPGSFPLVVSYQKEDNSLPAPRFPNMRGFVPPPVQAPPSSSQRGSRGGRDRPDRDRDRRGPHSQPAPFYPPPRPIPPEASRALWLANVPADASFRDLCKLGNQFGVLDQVRRKQEKNCAWLYFVEIESAVAAWDAHRSQPLRLAGSSIKVDWAMAKPMPPELLEASRGGATRSLWVGNLADSVTEDKLREAFAPFSGGVQEYEHVTIRQARDSSRPPRRDQRDRDRDAPSSTSSAAVKQEEGAVKQEEAPQVKQEESKSDGADTSSETKGNGAEAAANQASNGNSSNGDGFGAAPADAEAEGTTGEAGAAAGGGPTGGSDSGASSSSGGKPLNYAFVNFLTLRAAVQAYKEMKGQPLDGQPLNMNYAREGQFQPVPRPAPPPPPPHAFPPGPGPYPGYAPPGFAPPPGPPAGYPPPHHGGPPGPPRGEWRQRDRDMPPPRTATEARLRREAREREDRDHTRDRDRDRDQDRFRDRGDRYGGPPPAAGPAPGHHAGYSPYPSSAPAAAPPHHMAPPPTGPAPGQGYPPQPTADRYAPRPAATPGYPPSAPASVPAAAPPSAYSPYPAASPYPSAAPAPAAAPSPSMHPASNPYYTPPAAAPYPSPAASPAAPAPTPGGYSGYPATAAGAYGQQQQYPQPTAAAPAGYPASAYAQPAASADPAAMMQAYQQSQYQQQYAQQYGQYPAAAAPAAAAPAPAAAAGYPYGAQAYGADAQAATADPTATSRCVYITGLPGHITYQDICQHANQFGHLDEVRIQRGDSPAAPGTAFVTFLDRTAAVNFLQFLQQHPVSLRGAPVSASWAISQPINPQLMAHVAAGATRNLIVTNLHRNVNEATIRELFAPYTYYEMESIIMVPGKNAHCYVNMVNLAAAITAKAALHGKPLQGQIISVEYAREGR